MNLIRFSLASCGLLAATFAFAQHEHATAAAPASADNCCAKAMACCEKDMACCGKDAAACCTKDAACCEKKEACCATASTAKADAGCCAADAKDTCCELLSSYVPISDALAADDLAKAKESATTLVKQASDAGLKSIAAAAHGILTAKDIKAAREAFKSLSKELTPMAGGAKGYTVMTCPMANADWVQTDTQVRNPYYGKSMLRCGGPKSEKS